MDVSILLGQVGGSAATAELVLEEFVKQTPLDVENVVKNLAAGDLVAAGKVAHSLKGASGVFGAHQLREAAANMEMVCREGSADKANEMLPLLQGEAKKCMDYIPEIQRELKK